MRDLRSTLAPWTAFMRTILLRDRERFIDRHRAARNALREILAVDEFHHERRDTRLPWACRRAFFKPVDAGDVRMIQRRECLRFACEPREPIRIARE